MKHKKSCQVCSTVFETKHTGTLYCSNACKQKSFRGKRSRNLKSLLKSDVELRKNNKELREKLQKHSNDKQLGGDVEPEPVQEGVGELDGLSESIKKLYLKYAFSPSEAGRYFPRSGQPVICCHCWKEVDYGMYGRGKGVYDGTGYGRFECGNCYNKRRFKFHWE